MPERLKEDFYKGARDMSDWSKEERRKYYLQNPSEISLKGFSEGQIIALAKRALHHIMLQGGSLGLGD